MLASRFIFYRDKGRKKKEGNDKKIEKVLFLGQKNIVMETWMD